MRQLKFTIAAFLVTIAVAYSQTAPAHVNLRFLFLDEQTPDAYEVEINGNYQKVGSYPYAISTPIQVAPGSKIPVSKKTQSPEGTVQRTPIGVVKVPENSDSLLVVLEPVSRSSSSSSPLDYKVDYFQGNSSEFQAGTARVLNLGRTSVALALGEEMAILQPRTSRILSLEPDKKNRLIARVAAKTGSDWKVIYDSVSVLRPGERMVGVFVYSPSGMRHTYTEAELEVMEAPKPGHHWLSYTETIGSNQ